MPTSMARCSIVWISSLAFALPECWLTAHVQIVSLGDLNTGAVTIHAVGPGAASSVAYFTASDLEHGEEVWSTFGGSAQLFRDARPGPESSHPSQFTAVASHVVYVADDGFHGPELFTTASISASGLLAEVQPGSTHEAPHILGSSNGYLWFTTPSTSTDPSQRPTTELWVTNGTSSPTKRGVFAEFSITAVTVLSTRPTVLFLARYFGAPEGHLTLFCAHGNGIAYEIDRLRTSSAVPVPSTPVYAATDEFVCYSRIDVTGEPMVCPLSGGSPSVLLNIMNGSSAPADFVSNETDTICFAATSIDGGREVWSTGGTSASTILLADVMAGAGSSNPTHLMMSRGNPGVFFQVESGSSHRDLYFANPELTRSFRKYDSWVENTQKHTIIAPDQNFREA